MMNGKVRAFNGDMGMAMSVFKDMVGKVRFVFADPPYKITQARYDKEGFDYKAMWEVIQKMLCPYGVVAVTCSLTAAVEIMRVAPAGWYRYDLVWHKTTPTGFLNAKKAPLRNHELILIFSPMPLSIPKRLMVMSGKYPRPLVKQGARKRNYTARPVSLHTIARRPTGFLPFWVKTL